jgi:hypothetical protein
VLFLDCAGGAAGDMVLCALAEACGDVSFIDELPSRLGFADITLEWPTTRPGGFAARRLNVHFDRPQHPRHRNLADVEKILDDSAVSEGAVDMARCVFRRLAEAEGEVHGQPANEVHFHEVGAVDAIIDILGACLALEKLQVDEVVCSEGVPVRSVDVEGETVTPTGAALVTALANRFGTMPTMTVDSVGVGAGSKEYPGLPNVVRAFVGTSSIPAGVSETGNYVVECNIDDLDPRVLPVVIDRLLQTGALDAYVTPLVMKKGRPGHLLTAVAPDQAIDNVVDVVLRETSSLGCRTYPVTKYHLQRRMETVATPWGTVPVKVALIGDEVLRRVPEFEACAELARTAGVPVRDILAAAGGTGYEGPDS